MFVINKRKKKICYEIKRICKITKFFKYIPVSSFISSIYSIPTNKTSGSPSTIGVTTGGRLLVSVLTVTTGEITFESILGTTVPSLPAKNIYFIIIYR